MLVERYGTTVEIPIKDDFNTVTIYVPSAKQLVRISEGTGDNLLDEDMEAGYVDYIYYEQYELGIDFPEVDGGMILREKLIREEFTSMKDCIPHVLSMAYGSDVFEYIVLE